MLEFWVSAEAAMLELDTFAAANPDITINNDPYNPTDLIYLILPKSNSQNNHLYWETNITLTGPNVDLIILTNSHLTISDSNFSDFRNILVSDNEFQHDGKKFLVIDEAKHQNRSITFEDCTANNAYFLCNSLKWLRGAVVNELYPQLHGEITLLDLEGVLEQKLPIGNIILPEQHKPDQIILKNLKIKNNLICNAQKTLFLENVISGKGKTLITAEEIERLSNFSGLSEELIVRADQATIGSFIMPIGKIYIDVNCFLDFKADGNSGFKGIDLYIDVSKTIDEKCLKLPANEARFDKVFIKGAKTLEFTALIVAESMHLVDCLNVSIAHAKIGHLKHEITTNKQGFLTFGALDHDKTSIIGSLWAIGRNNVVFYAPAEIFDFDSEGRCNLAIYNSF